MLSTLALAGLAAHAGPWGAGFGFLFFLIPLFWIGLIVLIFALAGRRWRRAAMAGGYGRWGHGGWGHGGWASGSRAAEVTLAERFAQGDIDEKEYRARLEVLRASNPHEGPAPR